MSSARETWEKRVKVENKNPRSSDGGLGHDELRDRWLERYPGMAWSGGDWYRYRAGYWTKVATEAMEAQAVDVLEGSREEGVKITGHLLNSVTKLCKIATFVAPEKWDANSDALVLKNGTLDIPTRALRDHSPEDYATSQLPYDYDPEAKASMFLGVLGNAIPDVMEFVQEYAGYCLTIDTSYEIALWFKGPRGSGKSTVIEGLVAMLGARHGILGLAEIEASRFALAKIPGKTLLTSTEQPSSYLKSTHIIDALISGETLLIDRKNRDAQELKPIAKVIWAMNDLPRIANTTSGIFRRVRIVEFPELKGEANPLVKEYIKEEGAGILNWALDGLSRLEERGRFDPPRKVRDATANFELSNDVPALFVEEECRVEEGKEVASSLLYSHYNQWCKDNNHKPMSSTRMADEWKRLGFERKITRGRKFWTGVELRGGQEL